ncbi:hypothetical protein [Bordetella flabilis]|uniref:hypothetical protein n=1 Tax=Bordetella flabilis TaxID=463014 RepID=UPI000A8C4294|nr:hypothetical protein [Bordetella flabilis]
MQPNRPDRNIAVGCPEGMWLLDHADATPYYAARVWTALAAVLTALALWWLLG